MGLQVSFTENLQNALPTVISYLHTGLGEQDLFAPDHIIVPNAGVRAWLLQSIASQVGASSGGADGVAANINIQYLGAIDSFLGRGNVANDPWAVGPLSLSVLSVISRNTGSFTTHIERMGGGLKAARLMADRFDKYNARRPGMIAQWEAGNCALSPEMGADGVVGAPQLSPQDAWQFDLWQSVRAEIGVEPWPVVVEDLLEHPEKLNVEQLPHKLMVMGLQSLSVRHIRALELLSQFIHIEVVLVHPSPALQHRWSGVAAKVARSKGVAPLAVRQKTIDSEIDPLVGMWLKGAHDAHILLASQDIEPELVAAQSFAAPSTLLEAVQQSVHTGTAVALDKWQPEPSFSIHRAHNLSRQVEILHDELLHAFATIPGLEPHDVVIMCADIEQAAPLLEATFRKKITTPGKKSEISLPFIVADRGLRHVDDGAALLSQLLSVLTGRFSIEDIMSVATSELVMKKVGASQDSISLWHKIIERTGVRWGASPEHRSHFGVTAPVTAHTWLNGIHRSLVGALMPPSVPNTDFGNTVPLQDLDAADISAIARLSRVVSVLANFENNIHQQPKNTVIAWADALQQLLEELVANEKGELDDAYESLNTMRQYVTSARGTNLDSLQVTFQHFAEQLDEQLSSAPGRQPLRTGAITATSVIPLRSVPFKVVCLLGFDEGTLQAGEAEGDDLVSRQEFIGDSNPRIDQRRGILDAVCAASHRFVLTCNGRSIKNNEEVPLITPLAELVDLCVRCGVTEARKKGYTDVEFLHPRHFSSPKNFVKDAIVPGRIWSHDSHVLSSIQSSDAVTELAAKAQEFEAEAAALLAEETHVAIRPQVLERWMQDPLTAFIRRSLKINTWSDTESDDPATLPLSLTKNETASLMYDAIRARTAGIDAEHWGNINVAVGNFPVGEYGAHDLDLVTDQTDNLEILASNWGVDLREPVAYPISVPFDGGELTGTVVAYAAQEGRIALLNLSPKANDSNRPEKLRTSLAFAQLLMVASGHPVNGGVAIRWTTGKVNGVSVPKIAAQFVVLNPAIQKEQAIARVQELCGLYLRACVAPYPFFDNTAKEFVGGDIAKARREFASCLAKNFESEEGKSFTYVTTNECLVYGGLPFFDDIYVQGNSVHQFFEKFFASALRSDKDTKDALGIKKTSPPNGGTAEESYVYI